MTIETSSGADGARDITRARAQLHRQPGLSLIEAFHDASLSYEP